MAMILHAKFENTLFGMDLLICGAPNAYFVRTLKGLPFSDAISAISWYSYAYGYVFATPTRNPWPGQNSLSPLTLTLASWLLLIDFLQSALDPCQLIHEQSALSPEPSALAMVHELLALTKIMQSCQNRICTWKSSEFRIQKPHHHCNIDRTLV